MADLDAEFVEIIAEGDGGGDERSHDLWLLNCGQYTCSATATK